jgi:hypothetical protein
MIVQSYQKVMWEFLMHLLRQHYEALPMMQVLEGMNGRLLDEQGQEGGP